MGKLRPSEAKHLAPVPWPVLTMSWLRDLPLLWSAFIVKLPASSSQLWLALHSVGLWKLRQKLPKAQPALPSAGTAPPSLLGLAWWPTLAKWVNWDGRMCWWAWTCAHRFCPQNKMALSHRPHVCGISLFHVSSSPTSLEVTSPVCS